MALTTFHKLPQLLQDIFSKCQEEIVWFISPDFEKFTWQEFGECCTITLFPTNFEDFQVGKEVGNCGDKWYDAQCGFTVCSSPMQFSVVLFAWEKFLSSFA